MNYASKPEIWCRKLKNYFTTLKSCFFHFFSVAALKTIATKVNIAVTAIPPVLLHLPALVLIHLGNFCMVLTKEHMAHLRCHFGRNRTIACSVAAPLSLSLERVGFVGLVFFFLSCTCCIDAFLSLFDFSTSLIPSCSSKHQWIETKNCACHTIYFCFLCELKLWHES